jgi:hypothetical protein
MFWGRFKFLLQIGIAVVLMLAGFELFLRSSGASQPPPFIFDERFGDVMKPNTDAVFINEGFRLAKVNEYGYLGPAYSPEKKEGTTRIALFGDSYVAGREVFDRHHFRSILERELNKTSAQPVEVINLGFPTTCLERFYVYYETFGKQFCPDYAVYFVGRASLSWKRPELRPNLVVHEDSLTIDYGFMSNERYLLRKKLARVRNLGLFWLYKKGRELHDRGEALKILLGRAGNGSERATAARERARGEGEMRDIRPVNRAIVQRLGELNRRCSPRCIIVARERMPRSFVRLVKENGLDYFDVSPELDRLAETEIDPCYWKGSQRFGHWNQHAHRVVGEVLAEKMEPLLASR